MDYAALGPDLHNEIMRHALAADERAACMLACTDRAHLARYLRHGGRKTYRRVFEYMYWDAPGGLSTREFDRPNIFPGERGYSYFYAEQLRSANETMKAWRRFYARRTKRAAKRDARYRKAMLQQGRDVDDEWTVAGHSVLKPSV